MNPLEFDDWLLHFYLHPLDNFIGAAPWRWFGRSFRITAAKSEYGLQAAVVHYPGELVLGSAYMALETVVVGHLHHLIERMHRDALQRGFQVKTLPEPPGFQQLRFVIAVSHSDHSEPRRGRAVLALGRFEPLLAEIAQPGFGERERDARLPFRHSQSDNRQPVTLLVHFFERVTEPVMTIIEQPWVGDVFCCRFNRPLGEKLS